MNNVLAAVVLTAAAVGGLLLVPTGDGSYGCGRPPAFLIVAPAAEDPVLRQDFFDVAHQCNRDARQRGVEALAVLATGVAAVGLVRARR
jgi:hypothetical protein